MVTTPPLFLLEESKELKAQIKNLKNEMKAKDKVIHDITRSLESCHAKVKSSKSEISQFKICRSKLEAELKKLKKENIKIKIRNESKSKLENGSSG